jgi:hypothetical protein
MKAYGAKNKVVKPYVPIKCLTLIFFYRYYYYQQFNPYPYSPF